MTKYIIQFVYEVRLEATDEDTAERMAWEEIKKNPPSPRDLSQADILEEGEI